MSDTSIPPDSSSGAGSKIPILFGAVVALAGASVYSFYQTSQIRAELADTRQLLASEISQVHETTTSSSQSSRVTVDHLRSELEEARQQASKMAGQARIDA